MSDRSMAPEDQARFSSSYSGYPQTLPTHAGMPMSVVLNALAPVVFTSLWGMSLLERNLRLVERFGVEHIYVLVRPENATRAMHRHFPGTCAPEIHSVEDDLMSLLCSLIRGAPGPVLLLEGHVVYDRRLVGGLWQCPAPAVLRAPAGGIGPLLVDAGSMPLLECDWADGPVQFCSRG
jgi:hypothetical protein